MFRLLLKTIAPPALAAVAGLALLSATSATRAAEEVTLNLKDAEIGAVIETVSEVTGRNFIVDPRVKGRVTVVSSEPMDPAEVYQVFLSVLEVYGFAAVDTGEVTKIVPSVNAKQVGKSADGAADEIVTRVITLDNVAAPQLVPILRPLVPQHGHLAAYPPSNILIVADRAANVARITKLVHEMDSSGKTDSEVVQLEHASAMEIARILNSLQQKEQAGKGGGQSATVVADERTNSVLLNGDRDTRLRMRALISELDQPLEGGGNTHVVYLRYAKAEDLVEVLKGVSTSITKEKQGKGEGQAAAGDETVSIQAEPNTNALVINAPPEMYRQLRRVVRQLDVRRAQVLVEAIIAEIRSDKAAELGLQWAVDGRPNEDGVLGLTNFGGQGSSIVQLQVEPLSIGEGLSVGVGDFNGNTFRFGALLRALASDADTNILSTPSLVTLDNEEAEIVVGQTVPFITGQFTTSTGGDTAQNPFQTIEREDVGLTLRVKPQINEGNAVKLDIEQEVSSISPSTTSAADLITNKRSIQTSVLIEDDRFVVLGGLIDEDLQESAQKVPGLGDLPGIGGLFRYNTTRKSKRNLMVFLHPVILRNAERAGQIASEKYSYMRAQQLAQRGEGVSLLPDSRRPLLPPRDELVELPAPFEDVESTHGQPTGTSDTAR